MKVIAFLGKAATEALKFMWVIFALFIVTPYVLDFTGEPFDAIGRILVFFAICCISVKVTG